ncbi:MAG: amidohydrolase [Bacteroidetes bacterium]|nr:MAG: amidohydrolase [Bacteroidota bacterium]
MIARYFSIFSIIFFLAGCTNTPEPVVADLILINGNFYTVDEEKPRAEVLAIKDGLILEVGSQEVLEQYQAENTEIIDLEGAFAMPGFIEGHGHFSGLGASLINLNFLKSKNWREIVGQVADKVKTTENGEWIIGRGWHQEKWDEPLEREVLGYPYHHGISEISPNNPVILIHASGHSLFANKKAMEIAGISPANPNPSGGEIVRDNQGEAIGVFEETAMGLIRTAYNEYLASLSQDQTDAIWRKGVDLAQEECLKKGITSFQDAGSSYEEIDKFKAMAENGEFDLRLWAMLRHSYDEMKDNMEGLPVVDAGDGYFTCRAIKSEIDGALGAYGAWLLSSYNDKLNFEGQNTTPIEEVENIAGLALKHDMQLCVHAIGDRGNQEILNLMETIFHENPEKKDLRWRMEHAQHLDTLDIPRFKQLGVIASMQGVHCISDAPFVEKRLGYERAKYGAYPWRSLLDNGAVVTNGTDAPVEDVDPLESFYASVTRKRIDTGFEFFPEQSMTREEAIYSYTQACAFAAFEENDKGSLKAGKYADIVVLSNDLIKCTEEEILSTEVMMTMVGGEIKYQK